MTEYYSKLKLDFLNHIIPLPLQRGILRKSKLIYTSAADDMFVTNIISGNETTHIERGHSKS